MPIGKEDVVNEEVRKHNSIKRFFWRLCTVLGFPVLIARDVILNIYFYLLLERRNHREFMEKGYDEFENNKHK